MMGAGGGDVGAGLCLLTAELGDILETWNKWKCTGPRGSLCFPACNWADLKAAAPGHSCLQGAAKGWVATPTFAPRVGEMEPRGGKLFPWGNWFGRLKASEGNPDSPSSKTWIRLREVRKYPNQYLTGENKPRLRSEINPELETRQKTPSVKHTMHSLKWKIYAVALKIYNTVFIKNVLEKESQHKVEENIFTVHWQNTRMKTREWIPTNQ